MRKMVYCYDLFEHLVNDQSQDHNGLEDKPQKVCIDSTVAQFSAALCLGDKISKLVILLLETDILRS